METSFSPYSPFNTIDAGIIKGKIVKKSKIKSGFYTLIIGGIAALVAYFVGYGLHFLVL